MLFGVAANFATDGIKTWLVDAFPQGETKIYIGDDPVRKSGPAEIQEALDEYLRRREVSLGQ